MFGISLTENPVHQHFNHKSTADKSTCSIYKVQLSGKNSTSLSKFINIIIFCFFLSEINKTRLERKHYLDPKCSVVDLDSDLVDSNLFGLLDPDRVNSVVQMRKSGSSLLSGQKISVVFGPPGSGSISQRY